MVPSLPPRIWEIEMVGRNRRGPNERLEYATNICGNDDHIVRSVAFDELGKPIGPSSGKFHAKEIAIRRTLCHCQEKRPFARSDFYLNRLGTVEDVFPGWRDQRKWRINRHEAIGMRTDETDVK